MIGKYYCAFDTPPSALRMKLKMDWNAGSHFLEQTHDWKRRIYEISTFKFWHRHCNVSANFGHEHTDRSPELASCALLFVKCWGWLFRVDPHNPKLEPLPIDDLFHLNNDDCITPDGQTVIVNNSPKPLSSVIYTVQVTGGVPKRVTYQSPSWWRCITSDGSTVAYTARRDGIFDIYNCPLEGGEEFKLVKRFWSHWGTRLHSGWGMDLV